MDVSDLVRRLARRWIGVVVVVVLALAVAAVGWSRAGQTRQTVAAVVIVPPKFGDDVTGQNPLLNLDNNLAQLATVLAQAMQSSEVSDALGRNGASGSFTVSTVTGTNPSFSQLSPQLLFTVTGTDEGQTLFSARTIVAQARVQLAALQDRAGVAAAARATLVESAQPTSADVVSGGRLRVAGSLGLGVLVLGLLALLVIDTVLGRRRRELDTVGTAGTGGGVGPATVDPQAAESDPAVAATPASAVETSPAPADEAPQAPIVLVAPESMGEPPAEPRATDVPPEQPAPDDAAAETAAPTEPTMKADATPDSGAQTDTLEAPDEPADAAPTVSEGRPPAKKAAARKTANRGATSATRKTSAKRTGRAAERDAGTERADDSATSRPLRAGR